MIKNGPYLSVALLIIVMMNPFALSSEPKDVEIARKKLGEFKQSLMSALVEGLKSGPREAIKVCRIKAPEIADSAQEEGIRIGRTSHRVRNPLNRPEPWMKAFLNEYLQAEKDRKARWNTLPDGTFVYVEPIYVKGLCLKCHGQNIKPGLRVLLDELYPLDNASGFQRGDFRGLFWVKILGSPFRGD
jgi:hypothetical protein